MDAYNTAIKYLQKKHGRHNKSTHYTIALLVKQYYYGVSVKQELADYLKSNGIK